MLALGVMGSPTSGRIVSSIELVAELSSVLSPSVVAFGRAPVRWLSPARVAKAEVWIVLKVICLATR